MRLEWWHALYLMYLNHWCFICRFGFRTDGPSVASRRANSRRVRLSPYFSPLPALGPTLPICLMFPNFIDNPHLQLCSFNFSAALPIAKFAKPLCACLSFPFVQFSLWIPEQIEYNFNEYITNEFNLSWAGCCEREAWQYLLTLCWRFLRHTYLIN